MARTAEDLRKIQTQLNKLYPEAICMLEHRNAYELTVATILSAQCTDARVNITTPPLFKKYPTPNALASASTKDVEKLIKATGFYKNKSKFLIAMAQRVVRYHQGKIPGRVQDLIQLPGVGKKTANVVLSNAFGIPAMAVDTHVGRLARRLGLSFSKNPDRIEKDLCSLFSKKTWTLLHHQLITHGRTTCKAQSPLCNACSLQPLCPTGLREKKDPHTGRWVKTPERVVSLVPSVTELLCQWGLASSLVGRTNYCIHPAKALDEIPKVGGTKNPRLKDILAVKPTLVILERTENTLKIAQELEAARIPILVLDVTDWKSWIKAYQLIGQRLHRESKSKHSIVELKRSIRGRGAKPLKVLILVWKSPWILAGSQSYCGGLVQALGGRILGNTNKSKSYPQRAPKDLERLNPDLILLPTEPYPFNERERQELEKSFPKSKVAIINGELLTWYLSRTSMALRYLKRNYFT